MEFFGISIFVLLIRFYFFIIIIFVFIKKKSVYIVEVLNVRGLKNDVFRFSTVYVFFFFFFPFDYMKKIFYVKKFYNENMAR